MNRADFDSALAAWVSVALPVAFLAQLDNKAACACPSEAEAAGASNEVSFIVAAAASYLAAAGLCTLLRRYPVVRFIQGWWVVSLLGSALLAFGPFHAFMFGPSIFTAGFDFALFYLLALYTMPFAALAYYGGALFRAFGKRRRTKLCANFL